MGYLRGFLILSRCNITSFRANVYDLYNMRIYIWSSSRLNNIIAPTIINIIYSSYYTINQLKSTSKIKLRRLNHRQETKQIYKPYNLLRA